MGNYHDYLESSHRHDQICTECIEESDLQAYIADSDRNDQCSFCRNEDAKTCNFLDLMHHIKSCVEAEYDLAANCLAYESREGGWLWGDVWDTSEMLTEIAGIGLPRDDGSLLSLMVNLMGGHQDWCVKDPYGEDPLNVLQVGWERFCALIKHHTRFFVTRWNPPHSPLRNAGTYPTPTEVLDAIGDHVIRLELLRGIEVGTTVYRARYCEKGQQLLTPSELGPPFTDSAIVSNRMNPPGVVMFYSALDPNTALMETADIPGLYAIGTFRVHRQLRILDLTKLPHVPGFFAKIPDSQSWTWRNAHFFHDFVNDLIRPIERDDRVHVEYIPTQVVTEYFRHEFHRQHDTVPLDGILYPSARHPGHASLVLFADRANIVGINLERTNEDQSQWLELTWVEHRITSESDIKRFKECDNPINHATTINFD